MLLVWIVSEGCQPHLIRNVPRGVARDIGRRRWQRSDTPLLRLVQPRGLGTDSAVGIQLSRALVCAYSRVVPCPASVGVAALRAPAGRLVQPRGLLGNGVVRKELLIALSKSSCKQPFLVDWERRQKHMRREKQGKRDDGPGLFPRQNRTTCRHPRRRLQSDKTQTWSTEV